MAPPQPVSSRDLALSSVSGAPSARLNRESLESPSSDSQSFETILTKASRAAASRVEAEDAVDPPELLAPEESPAPVAIAEVNGPSPLKESRPAQELPAHDGAATRNSDPVPIEYGPSAPKQPSPPPQAARTGAAPSPALPLTPMPGPPSMERLLEVQAPSSPQPQVLPPVPVQPHTGPEPPLPVLPTTDGAVRDGAVVVVTPPVLPAVRRQTTEAPNRDVVPTAEENPTDESKPEVKVERPRDSVEAERLPRPPQTSLPPPASSPSAPPSSATPSAPPPASFLELQPQPNARGGAPSPASTGSPSTPSTFAGQAPAAGPAEEFSPQIVRGFLAMTRTSGGAMTMRLEPESLGSLRIQMHVSQGRVAVQFHAETAQARGLLTQHLETLRTAMESHGLRLENVQIHSLHRGGASGGGGQESASQQQQPSTSDQGSRQDAAGQQSRGHGDTAEREAQYRHAARQALHHQNRHSGSWQEHWSATTASQSSPSQPAGESRPPSGQ